MAFQCRSRFIWKSFLNIQDSFYQRTRKYSFCGLCQSTAFRSREQSFWRVSHNGCSPGRERRFSTFSMLSSSSSSSTDTDVFSSMDSSEEYDDSTFDPGVEVVDEEHLAHLRVRLYPLENEDDALGGALKRLYEAASIQQVFDVVEENSSTMKPNENIKIASQALVTVWDLQKLLFKISPNFDPERDYFDRPTFIEKVSQHPVFLDKIVKPLLDNCENLDDEPLLATLFCLGRLNYDIRGAECEKLIQECLRRRETLSLPSVSRLCVCMRNESLYGQYIVSKFLPLLWEYVGSMSEDLEVRLVSISLKSTLRLISSDMIDHFRVKLESLRDDFDKWETVTLCKVFLLLLSCNNLGTKSKHMFDEVGQALIPRVPTMQLMDLLSLQKFLELASHQPYGLVEALVQRMMRIVQEGVSSSLRPRLDLLASIAPYLNLVQQRQQLTSMLRDFLENHKFELAAGILFTMLRWCKSTDRSLYDQFWKIASDFVVKRESENVLDRRILKLGKEYVSFCFGLNFSYRFLDFEHIMKRYIYMLIDNYISGQQPCVIYPGDIARAFTFLIGCASITDPLFYDADLIRTLDEFAPQFRPGDLQTLSRGVDSVINNLFNARHPAPKYYNRVIEINSILEEQCARILNDKEYNQSFVDMLALHRVTLVTRKVKGTTPIIDRTLRSTLRCGVNSDRAIKDLSQCLLIGNSYNPEALQLMKNYLMDNKDKPISPDVIEKFVCLAFNSAWDDGDGSNEIWESCNERINRAWEKLPIHGLLQSCLGLCYYYQMSKELVENIFSVSFLDQIDAELQSTYNANQYTLRLRQAMMELNRAVCIDIPDINLPWFHTKFCEEVLSNSSSQENYLHKEVRTVLGDIVGDDAAVQSNMCSPYYYKLDFLIEFDEKDRPIRKNRKSGGFLQKFKETSVEVRRKVAVLILSPSSFTRNIRTLKGPFRLRRRHLEILGYDVVEIDPVHWNSMYMSENSMRQHFLESKLYSNAVM